jgi:acyl-CoA thioesterase-1
MIGVKSFMLAADCSRVGDGRGREEMSRIAILYPMLLMIPLLLTACDGNEQPAPPVEEQAAPAPTAPVTQSAAAPAAEAEAEAATTMKNPRVVFLGDSLTAGYGVERDEAFPVIVTEMLKQDGLAIDAVNAGVSGDTTAGGLRRLDWLLKQKPHVLVVGLGGNDGLRGLSLRDSENNLRQIITKARESGARVLLLGMLIPPNYGPEYTKQFREIYPKLSHELNVPLVPFLLEDVGGEAKYNQRDGIHPTPQGHHIVAKNVAPHLREVLGSLEPTRSKS